MRAGEAGAEVGVEVEGGEKQRSRDSSMNKLRKLEIHFLAIMILILFLFSCSYSVTKPAALDP
jgi:hypothetical protein